MGGKRKNGAGNGTAPGIPPEYMAPGSHAHVPLQGTLPNFHPAKGFTDWQGIAAAVERINQRYAVVRMGGKTVVLEEGTDAKGQHQVSFMRAEDFALWHAHDQHIYNGEMAGIGPLWLKNDKRRQYRGVVFSPVNADGSGQPPEGFYNLWCGYGVTPAKQGGKAARAKIGIFLDHLLTNIAQGDKKLANWIFGWFAHLIQRPTERLGTALVLRGRMGTGKSKLGEIVGSLIPAHYVMVDQPDHITGKHNAHMKSLLLLQVDEGFWAGDKQAEGKLKSLVTSRQQMIEPKNVDAVFMDNFVRLYISSNNDWVVPAGMEERRFAVIDVGDAAMQKHEYFAEMDAQMDNGGREALLRLLLDFDLSSVDLRVIPKTRALLDQKLASLKPEESFWYECLVRGTLHPDADGWQSAINVSVLYKSYVGFADAQGYRHKVSPSSFSARLHKLVPGLRVHRGRETVPDPMDEGRPDAQGVLVVRPRQFLFPSLKDCRAAFADAVRQDVPWEDDAGG